MPHLSPEIRAWRRAHGLPPEPKEDLATFLDERLGPIAVPTGTMEPLPLIPVGEGRRVAEYLAPEFRGPIPGTRLPGPSLTDRLRIAPEGSFSLGAGRFAREVMRGVPGQIAANVAPIVKAADWATKLPILRNMRQSLVKDAQKAIELTGKVTEPIERAFAEFDRKQGVSEGTHLEALILAAPPGTMSVGGVSALGRELGSARRVATQAAQKAAPAVRQLATEQAGAIRLSPESENALRNLKPTQKAGQIKAIQESTALSAEEKAARLKIIEEGPITTPVAPEALGPAAEPALAMKGVKPTKLTIPEGFILDAVLPLQKGVRFVNPTTKEERIVTGLSSDAIRGARGLLATPKAPVGAETRAVSESVGQMAKEPAVAPTGAQAAAPQGLPPSAAAVPPIKPPIEPPVTTGGMGEPPRPTPEEANAALGRLTQFIHSPESVNLSDLTVQVRQKQLGERLGALQSRTEALLSQGVKFEDAMKQAQGETMSGAFDRPLASLSEVMADQFRDSAFARVYEVLKNEPLERMSTSEALTNALLGKGIPRTPGTAGGSAYTRLSRVFPPEVMAILEKDKALASKFEDVLLQSGEKYKFTTEQPWPPPFEMKGEQPGIGIFGKAAEIQGQRPSPLTQGEMFDLQTFGMERPQGVSMPRYEAPIEAAIKMPSMWPRIGQNWFVRAAKELGLTTLDIANFLRSNKAGFDFSWWRQQTWLIPNHIRSFYKANIAAWRGMWDKKFAQAVDKSIKDDAFYYQHYEQAGYDFLRPLEQKGVPIWQREETYAILGGERPIAKFSEKIPWIRLPQRAFVTGTNSMNWDIFKGYVDDVYKLNEKIASGAIKLKPGEAFDIGKSIETHAKMLADMTGRAKLGPLKEMSGAINAGFFSMRLNLGRLLMPRHLFSPDRLVRKEAWKNILKTVGTIGAVELLGQKMGLWQVELDPRSPDVGQIRIGPLRYDPWGGMKKYVVLLARLATMETKSSKTGQVYPTNIYMTGGRFVTGMGSPGASMLSEVLTGETFAGEDVNWLSAKQWADRVAPMSPTDMWEAMDESNSVPLGIISGGLSAVGVGVTAYGRLEAKWERELKPYWAIPSNVVTVKRLAEEAGTNPVTREAYRTEHPEVDAKLFIIGEVSATKTGAAYDFVVRLMKENDIAVADLRHLEVKEDEPPERTKRRNNLLRDVGGAPTSTAPRSQPEPIPASAMSERDKWRIAHGYAPIDNREPTPVGAR